jgi:3-methyladenine DNA glycosylase Mpg
MANSILNKKLLKIQSIEIELTEIEFYFFDKNTHNDPFVHQDSLLKDTCNYIYVHKKAWQRGGMGISFGNGEFLGSILIRGIKHKGYFIAGSATVKKYIASLLDASIMQHEQLQEYFKKHKKGTFLISSDDKKFKIYSSYRVGLNKNKSKIYADAKYRFARQDYLNAPKDNNFESYANLKNKTKFSL